MQWIRFHNGHTQEGCKLHTKKSHPEFVGGSERCHIDINAAAAAIRRIFFYWQRALRPILNMIPILRLIDFIVFIGFNVGYF